ncbi:MAG: hypothetical protein H6622_03640 [Halobacteriovoraceae bacterium]|nr:hypothetical protein [Halobacteriovoraceae bacterium]
MNFNLLIILIFCSSCGVKSIPLPPENTIRPSIEEVTIEEISNETKKKIENLKKK